MNAPITAPRALAPLSARQRDVLDFIVTSHRARGYPPTLREIGAALEVRSTNGISDHLHALERKGYLDRGDRRRPRRCTCGKRRGQGHTLACRMILGAQEAA